MTGLASCHPTNKFDDAAVRGDILLLSCRENYPYTEDLLKLDQCRPLYQGKVLE